MTWQYSVTAETHRLEVWATWRLSLGFYFISFFQLQVLIKLGRRSSTVVNLQPKRFSCNVSHQASARLVLKRKEIKAWTTCHMSILCHSLNRNDRTKRYHNKTWSDGVVTHRFFLFFSHLPFGNSFRKKRTHNILYVNYDLIVWLQRYTINKNICTSLLKTASASLGLTLPSLCLPSVRKRKCDPWLQQWDEPILCRFVCVKTKEVANLSGEQRFLWQNLRGRLPLCHLSRPSTSRLQSTGWDLVSLTTTLGASRHKQKKTNSLVSWNYKKKMSAKEPYGAITVLQDWFCRRLWVSHQALSLFSGSSQATIVQ